jgi:hypothetical protein
VVTEGKRRVGFAVIGEGARGVDVQDLQAKLDKDPKDSETRVKLASALYDKGEREKALGLLVSAVAQGGLTDEKFSAVYDELARERKDYALKTKPQFVFKKLAKAPKLDGSLEDWAECAEKTVESWREVFLAGEEELRPAGRKPLWKSAADLKVSFRGGYDDQNLYLCFVVTDDVQKNDQTESAHCDLGDSVKVVFDIDRDGGVGYRGKDFELGMSLNKANAATFHRWVEQGKYIGTNTPSPAKTFAVRKEAEKQTLYQLALPLTYLSLPAEAGRKFGFSFLVNDQDATAAVEKSMGATPGVAKPPYPGMFAEGVLQEK